MQREDVQPWYRQFWPWFLILLPASAVVAGLYTLALAISTQDSLVVDSEQGITAAKERIAAAERRAKKLGLRATIGINPQTGQVTATLDSASDAALPDTLRLELSHPAFAERDRIAVLARAMPDAAGRPSWSGHFAAVPSGRWYVVMQSGDEWRLNGVWAGEPQLTLRPASDDGR